MARSLICLICGLLLLATGTTAAADRSDDRREDRSDERGEERGSVASTVMWGHWQSDGYFYAGQLAQSSGGRYLFQFDDGGSAWLTRDEFTSHRLQPGDRVAANWRRGGVFYDATVLSIEGRRIRVRYDHGGVEDTTLAQVRIRLSLSGMLTEGARVFAYWSDGYWYPARIEQREGTHFLVLFDDGVRQWCDTDHVTLPNLWTGDTVEAKWGGHGGLYYGAVIDRVDGEMVEVSFYDGSWARTRITHLRVRRSVQSLDRS